MDIADRIAIIQTLLSTQRNKQSEYERESAALDQAAALETKSSAGDKYETGREMIAQSRNIIQRNLSEAVANGDALQRMAVAALQDRISFGTLVETSLGWYLLGVGLGELEYHGIRIGTASLASPLGAALKGKRAGDKIPWKGGTLEIFALRH